MAVLSTPLPLGLATTGEHGPAAVGSRPARLGELLACAPVERSIEEAQPRGGVGEITNGKRALATADEGSNEVPGPFGFPRQRHSRVFRCRSRAAAQECRARRHPIGRSPRHGVGGCPSRNSCFNLHSSRVGLTNTKFRCITMACLRSPFRSRWVCSRQVCQPPRQP